MFHIQLTASDAGWEAIRPWLIRNKLDFCSPVWMGTLPDQPAVWKVTIGVRSNVKALGLLAAIIDCGHPITLEKEVPLAQG